MTFTLNIVVEHRASEVKVSTRERTVCLPFFIERKKVYVRAAKLAELKTPERRRALVEIAHQFNSWCGMDLIVLNADRLEQEDFKASGFMLNSGHPCMPFDLSHIKAMGGIRLAFASGVEAGKFVLEAMIHRGVKPDLVFGYGSKWSFKSGYADLSTIATSYRTSFMATCDLNGEQEQAALKECKPRYFIIAGWSRLVNEQVLAVPTEGCIGLHPTRLPEGRGNAPIPWTLIKGLKKSAVSMLMLDSGADAGPLIDQRSFDVTDDDDAMSIYRKVSRLQVELVCSHLPIMLSWDAKLPLIPQDHDKATVWRRRRPEDGLIDFNQPVQKLYDWVRGLSRPYPGAFTHLNGSKLIIWSAKPYSEPLNIDSTAPGTIVALRNGDAYRPKWLVACRDGFLELKEVQRETDIGFEKPISASELINSGLLQSGMIFGSPKDAAT